MKVTLRVAQAFSLIAVMMVAVVNAQGPAPETAPPLFPKGALVSYSSDFISRDLPQNGDELSATSHPTFSYQGTFTFIWGFHPNFDLTINVPIVTNRFTTTNQRLGGTSLGDSLVLVKYRFYRRDSERGTTQASLTAGPKFSTGGSGLRDSTGMLLPASLQPGSGSTDLFIGVNWTYTGLFDLKRLVADEEFHSLVRSTGIQRTRLGNDVQSRFWLSYRPYESSEVNREWFIGPTITWMRSQDETIASIKQDGSGGQILLAGVTTYVGVSAGIHIWFGMEWSVAHSSGENFMPIRRHIGFGITRQFRFI